MTTPAPMTTAATAPHDGRVRGQWPVRTRWAISPTMPSSRPPKANRAEPTESELAAAGAKARAVPVVPKSKPAQTTRRAYFTVLFFH